MTNNFDKVKNLPLRTEILDIALSLEQNVNSLLLIYLSIEIQERKAITNKSGNLSFKNKIDLLFDLEILNKDEYKYFLLLMEFRNQFLHNIECNSFTYAVDILGRDKEKSLMKFNELDFNTDKNQSRMKSVSVINYSTVKEEVYWSNLKTLHSSILIFPPALQEKSVRR